MSSYAIWNNKGGVGKTFVSFVTASAYAANNPGKTVIVIDMCPQANVSEILLGGNGNGAAHLAELLQLRPRRTVGGYFDQRIRTPHAKVGSELSFLTEVAAINNEVPRNLLLVAGDPSLEIQAQAINQIAAQTLPPNTWANVHSWVRDLLESIRARYDDCVFFIDCNPSFAAYTELALLSATRLIVPCTADGSSARAIDNVAQLIYGIGVPEDYRRVNFKARAEEYNMDLPVIHVVPLQQKYAVR